MSKSWGERFQRFAARALFVLWVPAVLVPGSYLLGRHVLTMPKPAAADPALAAAIRALRTPDEPSRWLALHVLYSECGCSQRVLSNLLLRSAAREARERIIYIGTDDGRTETKARALGYEFEWITREDLAQRYHLEAAPVLVVADEVGDVRYVGGYTDRKQGNVVRDRDIIANLVQGRKVETLPTFGCAVSKNLKSAVDPLGLR